MTKISDANDPGERAHGIVRGHTAHRRAGSSGITVRDGSTSGFDIQDITVIGGTWTVNSDGTAVLTIGAPGSGNLPWFNIRDFGAVGGDPILDQQGLEDATAALIAAGAGVLFMPACVDPYEFTSGVTLTVPCMVRGDGWATDGDGPVTLINFDNTTGVLFTATKGATIFKDFAAFQTGGTATAGACIVTTGSTLDRFEGVYISKFFTAIDVEDSLLWIMDRCYIENFRKFGVRIRNSATPDAGDWSFSDSTFSSPFLADAAVRIESSGGGKMFNIKVNSGGGSGSRPVTGIDVAVGTGVATSILLMSNVSVENIDGDAIRLVATGSGAYGQIILNGIQCLLPNNTGRLVLASGAGITNLIIDNAIANTTGTARAAISLTNIVSVSVATVQILNNFTSILTTSGVTGLRDDTGSIAAGVAITGTPTSGQVPVASSGTAAAWQTVATTAYDTDGLIPVELGSPSVSVGPPFVITVTSKWGIAAGVPYYDAANVVSGEEAALFYNPTVDQFVLVAYSF